MIKWLIWNSYHEEPLDVKMWGFFSRLFIVWLLFGRTPSMVMVQKLKEVQVSFIIVCYVYYTMVLYSLVEFFNVIWTAVIDLLLYSINYAFHIVEKCYQMIIYWLFLWLVNQESFSIFKWLKIFNFIFWHLKILWNSNLCVFGNITGTYADSSWFAYCPWLFCVLVIVLDSCTKKM